MTEELQARLYADFPEIFGQAKLSKMESCMHWGCECHDGWEPIIRNICQTIKNSSAPFVARKELFPHSRKLAVWLHNKCRAIERLFNITRGTLFEFNTRYYIPHPGWRTEFVQVKEKFGTLRIYDAVIENDHTKSTKQYAGKYDKKDLALKRQAYQGRVDGIIALGETLSSVTCENTGRPGKLYTRGWLRTLCPEEAEKLGYITKADEPEQATKN